MDRSTTEENARTTIAPQRPSVRRASRTALAALLFAGSIALPTLGAVERVWAQDVAPGEQVADDDQPTPSRRDRGARGAMPLPPDWPRAGGFGVRERGLIEGFVAGDMAGSDLSRREITDEELARAIKVASRVSEDWGRTLAARAEQDPAQMKMALRTTGRRLFALLVLEERAPKLFEAKIAELRAQGETARAAESLKRAQESLDRAGARDATKGDAADPAAVGKDDPSLAPLRAALDAAIARQIEATLAVRREELVAIESRIAEMRGAIERDAADTAALSEEIRTRALAPREQDGRPPEMRDGEVRRGMRDDRRGPRDAQGDPRGDGDRAVMASRLRRTRLPGTNIRAMTSATVHPHAGRPTARVRLGRAGRVGALVLGCILLACVASLPWSAGAVATGATEMPRYEASNLALNLLPPIWGTLSDGDLKRVEEARAVGQYVPGRVLGTDKLGRDVLARLLVGGSISLLVGLSAAAIAVIVGTTYGSIAGAAGGRVDAVLMRIVDILFGLPSILLVVLLAVAVDGILEKQGTDLAPAARQAINITTLLIAIGGLSWLTMARVIRGQVMSLRAKPFMESCRAIGVSPTRQFTRHLLPNLVGPIAVYAALAVPAAILSESFLSFLGIGVREPVPSWGNMAAEGLGELNTVESRWWLLAAPCLAIALTLVSLNFLGDELRERFDPMRGRRVA